MQHSNYINVLKSNFIDYEAVKQELHFSIKNDNRVNVSVIIPVRSRTYFNKILTKYLKAAMSSYKEFSYSITFVEHSDDKEHLPFCEDGVNYIHIPANGKMFNKCLSMNAGVFFSNKADFYLFHDLDVMVKKDFFSNIMLNLKRTDCRAIQPFKGKRVLYADEAVSMDIRNGKIDMDSIVDGRYGINSGTPGAPGGSLFVEHNHFFEIGGYDPELFFGYSIEDQFFFDKLMMTGGVDSCNVPPTEVIHLWHPPLWNSNPHASDHAELYFDFKRSPVEEKMLYMKLKHEQIKKYL